MSRYEQIRKRREQNLARAGCEFEISEYARAETFAAMVNDHVDVALIPAALYRVLTGHADRGGPHAMGKVEDSAGVVWRFVARYDAPNNVALCRWMVEAIGGGKLSPSARSRVQSAIRKIDPNLIGDELEAEECEREAV